jgi:hypothetical protein
MASMSSMEVEFIFTAKDAYRLHLAQLRKPGAARYTYLALLLAGPVIGAFMAGFFAWHHTLGLWGIALVFLSISALISSLYYLHTHWETRRYFRKHLTPETTKLLIAPEGLTITRSQHESRLYWDTVKELVDLEPERLIRIDLTTTPHPVFIPYRGFGDCRTALLFLETARRLKSEAISTSTSAPAITNHLRVEASPTTDDIYQYHLARLRTPGRQRWGHLSNYMIGPGIGAYFIYKAWSNDVYYNPRTVILVVIVITIIFTAAVYYAKHGDVRRRINKVGNPDPCTLVLRKEGLQLFAENGEALINWVAVGAIRMDLPEGLQSIEAGSDVFIVPQRCFKTPEHASEFHAAAVRYKAEASHS